MLQLLKLLDARMGEPSTYASIAAALMLAHVSVDPGTLHTVTMCGVLLAAALGVVLSEVGSKSPLQIAADAIGALTAAAKVLPPAAVALLLTLLVVTLTACSSGALTTTVATVAGSVAGSSTNPAVAKVVKAVCQYNGAAQFVLVDLLAPVVVAIDPNATPTVAKALAFDQTAIDPAVAAACPPNTTPVAGVPATS